MISARLVAASAVSMFIFLGCTHVVGFHPVKTPSEIDAKTGVGIRLYMAPELKSATHSFRAFGSGIANTWVVDYGARVHEFAVTYLPAAFEDFQEVDSPIEPKATEVLLTIVNVEYVVKGQAAHITMDVEATNASGTKILTQQYATRGWSGSGAVLGGGAFAQKGVTRSSTDQALKEIFLTLIGDLLNAL